MFMGFVLGSGRVFLLVYILGFRERLGKIFFTLGEGGVGVVEGLELVVSVVSLERSYL